MIEKIVRSRAIEDKVTIKQWSDCSGKSEYRSLRNKLVRMVLDTDSLKLCAEEFVNAFLNQVPNVSEEARRWEWTYLFHELAMSVYVTEVEGYPQEMWERKPEEGPDPMALLYSDYGERICELLGQDILRRSLSVMTLPSVTAIGDPNTENCFK